jgi:hypothetical protein
MQSWQNALRVKFNLWRLRRHRRRRGHLAARIELRETQVWCATRADLGRPKDCFRDERLRPSLLPSSRRDAVDDVRRSRSRCLYYDGHASADPATIVSGGRLIAYCPDSNLACGVCEAETKGYFDVDNTPPWDTWVALLDAPNVKDWESSLIAWVPSVFVPLVQAGIKVIPEQCVLWLDDCPDSLQRVWNKVVMTEQEGPKLLRLT